MSEQVADEIAASEGAVEKIKPILAGLGGPTQGLVLAELLSMWLAGHVSTDKARTEELHEEILELHIDTVRQMLPYQQAVILTSLAEALKPAH